eukprot:1294438-Pyramimonas_sp.AAC.1
MISGGTITASMKLARVMDEKNGNVVRLMKEGLSDVAILFVRALSDVPRYRKNRGNDFHDGGDAGVFEALEESPEVKPGWD